MASNHIRKYDLQLGVLKHSMTDPTRLVDPMVVPADVVAKVGKSPSNKIDEKKDGGYVFTLEVFHQLHCLVRSALDHRVLENRPGMRITICRMCCEWLHLAIITLASIQPFPPPPQNCVCTLVRLRYPSSMVSGRELTVATRITALK